MPLSADRCFNQNSLEEYIWHCKNLYSYILLALNSFLIYIMQNRTNPRMMQLRTWHTWTWSCMKPSRCIPQSQCKLVWNCSYNLLPLQYVNTQTRYNCPRNCTGMRFALLEIKMATLLKYKIVLAPETEVRTCSHAFITLPACASVPGCALIFQSLSFGKETFLDSDSIFVHKPGNIMHCSTYHTHMHACTHTHTRTHTVTHRCTHAHKVLACACMHIHIHTYTTQMHA